MITKSKQYRIHVTGHLKSDPDTYLYTYQVEKRPESREEIKKIAGDFETLSRIVVEEVTTIVEKKLIQLQ